MIELDECPFVPGPGTISAGGVLKNLFGSKLSVTEIFLREAVQNSYDARVSDPERPGKKKPLIFKIHAYRFSKEQLTSLKKLLGFNNPSSFFYRNILPNISENMLNIEVTDLNTFGLIGKPQPTDTLGDQNFAHFVYFTGNDKKKDKASGGSFGFGKASLYAFSKARTIIVYSRISSQIDSNREKKYQSRLIAIASDERIEDAIDRCWWGKRVDATQTQGMYAAPIIGTEADEIAASLGMGIFDEDQTGTSILVLNADSDKPVKDEYDNIKTIDEIIQKDLPRFIVHWYWNKIATKNIFFELKYENELIEIENPAEINPYKTFIKAYKKYQENKKDRKFSETKTFAKVMMERPKVDIGYISLSSSPIMNVKYKDLFPIFKSGEPVVAFMRGIGHIVYYDKFSFVTDNAENTCYGIFKTDTTAAPNGEEKGAVDREFRLMENQTHDKWEYQKGKHDYNYLKAVTFKVDEMVKGLCIQQAEEQKATDISIIIQRTLGEKLMPYISSIGGASVPLQEDSIQRNTIRKSSITGTIETEISMDVDGTKIVGVKFKLNVLNGKKIVIKKIVPTIQSADSNEEPIINPSVVDFLSLTVKNKDGGITTYNKKAFALKSPEFTKTQTIYINSRCRKDCAFNYEIEWEEVDAPKKEDN